MGFFAKNFPHEVLCSFSHGIFRQQNSALRNFSLRFFLFLFAGEFVLSLWFFRPFLCEDFPFPFAGVFRPFLLGVSLSFPAGFSCFSPRFSVSHARKNSRGFPGVFFCFEPLLTKRSSVPDRRWSRHSPNRTYNSPSRKPKADR